MNGYMGKLLVVDLSKKEVKDEPLNEQYARDFIGAGGIACRCLADMVDGKTDPLGPDNPLIFMAGLLTGTGAPSFSRWVAASRSPYTTYYADSNCGGFFGSEMRFAGYDGIIIRGRSDRPVYLYVEDGRAELRDASALWGMNSFETIREIRRAHSHERMRVACIGQAGENGVLMSGIMTEHGHCAGRAGLGCVMGSKRLKAVALRGTAKIPMADAAKFREAVKTCLEEVKGSFFTRFIHDAGTCGWVDPGMLYGDVPVKYYTADTMPEAAGMSGTVQAQKWQVEHKACYSCPVACRKVLHVREGRFATEKPVEGPEYETLAAWGSMLMISDMGALCRFNELLNGYGMDSISSGVSAAFAFYLYEKGIITGKDTGGLALEWGNIDAALQLVEQMGRNEGFGRIVAEGTRRMGVRYGCPAEAMHVKGLEIPMHDPRAFACMGLVYATGNRGADHNKSMALMVDYGVGNPDVGLVPGDRFGDDRAAMVVRSQDWSSFCDAIGLCELAAVPPRSILDMVNASTGWGLDIESALKAGERIYQLMRAVTCRLGVKPGEDKLPAPAMRRIADGGQQGHVPNLVKMLPEYYRLRDWDIGSGLPSGERMASLGMAGLAGTFGIKY